MGGVERLDQRMSVYRVCRRTNKYWLALFYHLLDLAIVNCLYMYESMHPEVKQKKNFAKDFRHQIAKSLLFKKPVRIIKKSKRISALSSKLASLADFYSMGNMHLVNQYVDGRKGQKNCLVFAVNSAQHIVQHLDVVIHCIQTHVLWNFIRILLTI